MLNKVRKLFDGLLDGSIEPIGLQKHISNLEGFQHKETKITLSDGRGRFIMKKTDIDNGEGFEYFATNKEIKYKIINSLINEK